MARLPQPGADNGTWGNILNEFLTVEHNADGTLKESGTLSSKADDAAVVHNSGAETITGAKNFTGGLTVSGTNVATTTDLASKADNSAVVHLAGTETITGAKTVPTPTAPGHIANKSYVDQSVATGLYTPSNWGQYWLPALAAAKAGSGLARVSVMGSSTAMGYYSSDLRATSWVERMRASLIAYSSNGGSGFEGMQRSDTFISGAPSGAYNRYKAIGNTWSQVNSWSTPTFWRGPALGYLLGGGGTSTVTIPFTGAALTVWYFDNGSPWTYSIDGGLPTTVTPGSSLAPSTVHASAGSSGSHTVTIASGASGVWLIGVRGCNTTGVVVDNYAIAGMQSGGWNMTDSMQSGQYAGGWHSGFGTNNAATAGPGTGSPDLLIIQAPTNDVIKAVQTYTNGSTTSSSTTVSSTSLRRADIGRQISGSGIPTGTTITSVSDSAGTAVISNAATATASGVTFTITDPDPATRWLTNIENYLAGVLDNVYGGGTGPTGATDIVFLNPLVRISSDPQRVLRDFSSKLYGLAQTYGAAVVDIGAQYHQSWSRWFNEGKAGNGNDPTTSGNDDVHASDAGHQYMADQLLTLIQRS